MSAVGIFMPASPYKYIQIYTDITHIYIYNGIHIWNKVVNKEHSVGRAPMPSL
jgi:hypothetical protein